jgi:hypothetical protein
MIMCQMSMKSSGQITRKLQTVIMPVLALYYHFGFHQSDLNLISHLLPFTDMS